MNFLNGDFILYGGEIYRILENYGEWGKVLHLESHNIYEIPWEYNGEYATKQIIVQHTSSIPLPNSGRTYFILSAWDTRKARYLGVYEPDGTFILDTKETYFKHNFEIMNDRFYILNVDIGEVQNNYYPYTSYRKAVGELNFVISQCLQSYQSCNYMIIS